MKTELLSQEKNIVVVKADFDAEQVTKAVDATYKKLSTKVNINGFRKGHVPRKTIELYFGAKAINEEALEEIIPQALDEMVEEYELKIIAEPDIKHEDLEDGKPFTLTATFEVSPEFDLPELDDIEAEKIIFTPTDAMVDDNVARLLEAHSEVIPSYEEREAVKTDYLSLKYTSSVIDRDGKASEVEKEQKTEVNLGQENMRPEVVDALVGKKPGDTVSIDFAVDEKDENKELSGKMMHYDMEILGIMKKVTPELTDETVEKITGGQNKTVAEFKETVMKELKASADRQSEESLKDSAIAKLMNATEIEIPESMLKRQKDALTADQEARIKRESGMTMDDFFEKSGVKKEEYDKEIEDAAAKIVKRGLILEAIAEANDIEWTREEIDAEIKKMALSSRIDPKKLHEYVYSDRDRIYEIAEKVRNRKTLDFLITKVKVKDVSEEEYKKTFDNMQKNDMESK